MKAIPFHVTGLSDLVDLWVNLIIKYFDPLSRNTSRSREQSTKKVWLFYSQSINMLLVTIMADILVWEVCAKVCGFRS